MLMLGFVHGRFKQCLLPKKACQTCTNILDTAAMAWMERIVWVSLFANAFDP